MSKWKKVIITILYLLVISIIIKFNADALIEWLNKSLFAEYEMDIDVEKVNNSFFKGASFIFFTTSLLYAVIGTFIVTIIVSNTIWIGFIVANQMKVQERNEYITFKELYTVTSPKELLKLIDMPISISLLVFIMFVILLISLHFITKKISNRLNFHIDLKTRFIILGISLIPLLFIFMNPNTYNELVLKFEDEKSHNFNPVKRARRDGFLPSFIKTIQPNYMDKPKNYTKSRLFDIRGTYTNNANIVNKERQFNLSDSQTIYYLSETLIDPKQIPDFLQSETPIPFISELQQNNIGGTMYSQYIGGGTANIEWSVLTSFSLEVFNEPVAITPYSDFYLQSKNHHTIMSLLDKEKIAIHPYTAHLYKRRSVYDAIGFDSFLYLDNGIQHTDKLGTFTRVSDESLHKDLLREMNAEDVQFLHVLSMQNHSPYKGEIPDSKYIPNINIDIYPEDRIKAMTNYLQGLHATDSALSELHEVLNSSDKKINLLFYGDHFPSLFRGLEDQFKDDQLHQTPWLIYMNHGRSILDINKENLSPIFLTTILLREGNYFVSPFQALLDEMLTTNIKRIGKDFIITDKGIIPDHDIKDPNILKLVEDYRLIMYDALFGSDWLGDAFYTLKN